MDYAFLRWPGFLDKAFTLSYDDGVVSDRRFVGLINEYGAKCTFNLNSALFGNNNFKPHVSEDEVKALYIDNGHEVATHGKNHYVLTAVPKEVAIDEIISDRKFLENLLQTPVCGHAYPNGLYDDAVVETLKQCGIVYARTIEKTHDFSIPTDWLRLAPTCHHKDPELLNLADAFLKGPKYDHRFLSKPLLFYVWGHTYEFDDYDNWNVMEELLQKVGKRDDVWYCTNMQVYRYVKAYEQLEFSADGSMIYNPTSTDLYLRYFGKNVLVKAGQTVNFGDITK
jgi:hypothetical protein